MPSMLSYPRRLQSGQITCYLNRTYHVLTTTALLTVDRRSFFRHHGTPDKVVAIPPPATAALPFRAIGCSVRGDPRGNSKSSCTSRENLDELRSAGYIVP